MSSPEIFEDDHIEYAAGLVRKYYTEIHKHGQLRTGSRFDSWAGGGDNALTMNIISADDLVAVSFLSVEIPARAAIGILETSANDISSLLAEIPVNLDLADIADESYESILGKGSHAWQLWEILRRTSKNRWGIGQTTVSKIMARKRPRLIPIYDSVIGPLMGLRDSGNQWQVWHRELAASSGLANRLKEIQSESKVDEKLSTLRVMDVVLWMHGKKIQAGSVS